MELNRVLTSKLPLLYSNLPQYYSIVDAKGTPVTAYNNTEIYRISNCQTELDPWSSHDNIIFGSSSK